MKAMSGVAAFSDFVNDFGLYIVAGLIALCIFIAVTLPRWRGALRAKFDNIPPGPGTVFCKAAVSCWGCRRCWARRFR